ncbi:hypothetical protein C0J52_15730 [Blattella germanica]|nr:hypothetical protein C0J52_15730 [Blattella germanica]
MHVSFHPLHFSCWHYKLRLKISGCNLLSIVMPATKIKRMETCMHEVMNIYFIFNDNQTVLPLCMSAVCPSRQASACKL